MSEELIEIGKIVNTHGIKGEIKVMPWADSPEFFDDIDYVIIDDKKHEIVNSRTAKNCTLLKLKDIDAISQAEILKNKVLFIYKKDLPSLPNGVYYIRDVIGLKVMTSDDKEIGIVQDILQTGANDVYEVKKPNGTFIYLPDIKECIKEVNIKEGFVLAEILEGLE